MRVWYILMTFPRPSETFVCNDIQALLRHGVEVSVRTFLPSPAGARTLLAERDLEHLPVECAALRPQFRGLGIAIRRPRTVWRLLTWIAGHSWRRPVHLLKSLLLTPRALDLLVQVENERPDVVHLYWGHFPAILGHLILDNCPQTTLSLGLSAYDLVTGYSGSQSVARRAHLVTTWAAANVDSIAALGVPREEVRVIYQGVDLDRVRGRDFKPIRHRIVTAGRLIAAKGMDDVLRAFQGVVSQYEGATLVILGEGSERAALEQRTRELGLAGAITFAGHVSHEAVFEQMGSAEVFLFMSRYEGERLPNVVKEAMACGCVVVTSRTPGIDEVIDDGINGYIVDQGDIEGVVERIGTIFSSPAEAVAMAAAGKKRVYLRFDLEKIMEDLADRWLRRREDGSVREGPSEV